MSSDLDHQRGAAMTFMKVYFGTMAIIGVGVMLAIVISSAVESRAYWARLNEENQRGYIRCIDGHWEMGNIDFYLEDKYTHIPRDQGVVTLKEEWCTP